MSINIQRAHERGHANHGRLDTYHSFSFANYYNPEKMGFGSLLVINEDVIDGGYGFPNHAHDNMEIITIPLSGRLAHKDSTGKQETIGYGDVQVMSAGAGVEHSEFNASLTEPVHLLQIRILPHTLVVHPRHDSKSFDFESKHNEWQLLVSDNGREDSLKIHQHAFISIATIDANTQLEYKKHLSDNGVYLFVIKGNITALNETLGRSDAIEITGEDNITISGNEESQVLILEVPMQ